MQPKWKQLITLIRTTQPPRLLFSIGIGLSLLTTVASLAIPLLASRLIDNFDVSQLSTAVTIGIIAAFFIQAVAGGVSVYVLAKVGQHIIASLRERLWKKLLVLPVSYYDEHETGDAVSRMTNDTGVIKNLITEHFTGFITGVISVVGAVIILFYLDWPLTLVMFSIIPLSLLFLIPVGRKMAEISRNLQAETAGFSAHLTRVISEIRLVKASNAETMEWDNGRRDIRKLYRLGVREGVIQALMSPLVSSLIIVVLVLIIGFGGIRVSSGAMTAGELAAFFIYLFQIIMPITQMVVFVTQFQKTIGATEKVLTILHMDEEELEEGKAAVPNHQPLSFQHISFHYQPDEPILKDVSFTAEKGQVTAVVGPSGSGKTTMFSLIEQFYKPVSGQILYGNESISRFALKSWRKKLGYVSQDSPIYAGTIMENLTYGLEGEVPRDRVIQAAEMAYAHPFINELAHGYETEVGERGIKLSGGQRQRIAIARALLRDPEILMLDEATSSLDSQSEVVVQHALKNLMKGRTTLVIAHRLSTIVDADRIVFLEKGEVTGVGSHEELFATHALYQDFARQQLRIEG
ncbi:ATP-binding cassette domain-containing protein [Halobacillus litoralis]|uniref:ATP-binding cassette domain-containing protein n=1 Tax=Halobacillus litoralis TaxID=45668 RepID=A0A845DT62_9BACI|nr:ABC transporter ATP-binding protein [Halobacillus litoralis]MYL20821.1 ATP-binding cassette domain-containing protein [Halobacillus litoralis]